MTEAPAVAGARRGNQERLDAELALEDPEAIHSGPDGGPAAGRRILPERPAGARRERMMGDADEQPGAAARRDRRGPL